MTTENFQKRNNKFFKCKCPKELRSRKDGIVHLVPIHCVRNRQEIIDVCIDRLTLPRLTEERRKEILNLLNKKIKKI